MRPAEKTLMGYARRLAGLELWRLVEEEVAGAQPLHLRALQLQVAALVHHSTAAARTSEAQTSDDENTAACLCGCKATPPPS